MNYSYEEFSDHLAAQEFVQGYRHITTPGAGPIEITSTEPCFEASRMRVMEYMRDLYRDYPEALRKGTCFISIMNFVSCHVGDFEQAGLAYIEDGKFLLKDAAWKAAHHLHSKQFFENIGQNSPNPTIEEVIALASRNYSGQN
jgi:hypothetical protein